MEEKTFNLVEIFGLMAWAICIDVIGMILVVFALDDVGILDILNLFPIGYLFLVKGFSFLQARSFMIGTGLEILPYVGALPILTITMAINLWKANHPESVIAQATSIKRNVGGALAAGRGPGAQGIKTPIGGLETKPVLTKTAFKQAA